MIPGFYMANGVARLFMAYAGAHNHGGETGSTGGGQPIDNRPAYVALAFIMKL